jgi:hypothetical protein
MRENPTLQAGFSLILGVIMLKRRDNWLGTNGARGSEEVLYFLGKLKNQEVYTSTENNLKRKNHE